MTGSHKRRNQLKKGLAMQGSSTRDIRRVAEKTCVLRQRGHPGINFVD